MNAVLKTSVDRPPMKVTMPQSLVTELRADQKSNAGNRIVQHDFELPLRELNAG